MATPVQEPAGLSVNNASSAAKAFGSSITAGNLVVVWGVRYANGANTAFVAGDCTKSAGAGTLGPIALDKEAHVNSANPSQAGIWSAPVTGTGAATIAIAGPAGSYFALDIAEYGGTDIGGARVESSNSNTAIGATSPATSGNATSAGGALFCACIAIDSSNGNTNSTVGNSFSLLFRATNGSSVQCGEADRRIVAVGTTTQGTWTIATGGLNAWAAALVAYKDASGGSGTATPSGVTAASAKNAPTGAGDGVGAPAGVTGASAKNAPTGSGGALVAGSGVTTASAENAPTPATFETATPAGVTAASAEHAPAATGGGTAVPAGVTAASAENAPTATNASIALPPGVTATTAENPPAGSGAALVTGTGVTAAAAQHAPTGSTQEVATPAGVTAASRVGTATAHADGNGTATPSGTSAMTSVGDATAAGDPLRRDGGGEYIFIQRPRAASVSATARVDGVRSATRLGVSRVDTIAVARATGVRARARLTTPRMLTGSGVAAPGGARTLAVVGTPDILGILNPTREEITAWTMELIDLG